MIKVKYVTVQFQLYLNSDEKAMSIYSENQYFLSKP